VAVVASIRSGLVIYEILAPLIWVFLLFIKVLFSPFIFSISQIQLILRHTRRVAPETCVMALECCYSVQCISDLLSLC
jgi:hypothetical protein